MGNTRIVFFVQLLIATIISGTGVYFILFPENFVLLQTKYTIIIGIIFLARGLFRGYNAYKNEFHARA
jgi:hypothetical protein